MKCNLSNSSAKLLRGDAMVNFLAMAMGAYLRRRRRRRRRHGLGFGIQAGSSCSLWREP